MARTRQLTQLIDDVRKRADLEGANGATDRFPDAEITEYINQSIVRLYAMLDRLDSTYYQATATISITSGTKTYALPDDFWTLKGVRVVISGNVQFRCRKYMPEEGQWLDTAGVWAGGNPVYYRLQADKIAFSPVPTGAYTVYLDYTKTPARLGAGTDFFDGIIGFEEWVVLDAAIKCKQKDSLDPSLLVMAKAEIEAWITTTGGARDVGQPDTIQDVQNDLVYAWPLWGA